MMRRDTLNFLVDLVGLLCMIVMIATGLLIKYTLPPGSRGGHGLAFLGLDRHEWGDIHFWAAVALAAMLVLHIALHWTWCCLLLERSVGIRHGRSPGPGRRAVYAVVLILFVVGSIAGFVLVAEQFKVRGAEHGDEHRGRQRRHRLHRGAMLRQPPIGVFATQEGARGADRPAGRDVRFCAFALCGRALAL